MGQIDVVIGTFKRTSDAESAAADIVSALDLDLDRVVTDHVIVAGERPARIVLVAWVPPDARRRARELIWRHHGRQAPFDWLSGRQERVSPDTFPVSPHPAQGQLA